MGLILIFLILIQCSDILILKQILTLYNINNNENQIHINNIITSYFLSTKKTELSTVRKFTTLSNTYSYTYTVTVRLSE